MLLFVFGCATPPSDTAPERAPTDGCDRGAVQDILTEDLTLDVATDEGEAVLSVCPAADGDKVALHVDGLTVEGVTANGDAVDASVTAGVLYVGTQGRSLPLRVDVTYQFPERTYADFDGWMPELGVSFVWPYFCGNLFPCDPSMDDGIQFSVQVTGVPDGALAVSATERIPGDAPSYMPALAVHAYDEEDLGTSTGGTHVVAFHFPEDADKSALGTAHLVDATSFYEETYGAYPFGPELGAVEVNWGSDSWGGMEHHPYFHVGMWDTDDEEATIHETGHAWYGDGVRIACWEDFVLSEGTNSYITARAMESVGAQPEPWSYYVDDFLVPLCQGKDTNTIVMRDGCNQIDFLHDDLWSLATYMKGACFYEEVGDIVGVDTLDGVLARFYQDHVGHAAHMTDMIEAIEASASTDQVTRIEAAKQEWLLTLACPADYAARCRQHGVE